MRFNFFLFSFSAFCENKNTWHVILTATPIHSPSTSKFGEKYVICKKVWKFKKNVKRFNSTVDFYLNLF